MKSSRLWMLAALALLMAAATVMAAPALIDSGAYATDAAAQAAWRPMGGSAPARIGNAGGAAALRFNCDFASKTIERGSWDRQVDLDLVACRGVSFQVFCRDASPISYFSLYFQSGDGWYHASFFPEATNAWETITLDKAAFRTEGQPAGWGKIRAIRLSAWRGRNADTEFYLRDVRLTGALGAEARVALVRAESASAANPDEARSVETFTKNVADLFASYAVECAVVSDLDLTPERLKSARLAVLPYNSRLPAPAADALARFVADGGKLLVFYSAPDPLQPLLGIEGVRHLRESRPGNFAMIQARPGELPGAPAQTPQRSWNINSVRLRPGARVLAEWLDDQGQPTGQAAIVGTTNGLFMSHVLLADGGEKKSRLLLAMAGTLVPDLWKTSVASAIQRAGVIGKHKTLADTAAAIAAIRPASAQASARIRSAQNLVADATRFAASGRYSEALDHAATARRHAIEAWCLAQSGQPGEFRAFWCHSAFGVEGLSWDDAARRLAENGFTAVLPNMLWGGVAYYDSQVLPVAPQVKTRGDQIALCVAAARKHGLQTHIWKVNWNLGHAYPKEFLEQMRRAGRLQADSQGKEEPWLCPSHPENQKLEIAAMVEVAARYDVDGIHFDYIRYPDSSHCFCAGCRERFQAAIKTPIANWPQDARTGPLREQWLEWRRSHITAVVQAVSEQARTVKPSIKISAAVFRNWPVDRDGVGQDWKLWCDRGWLDFVCPMDYTASHRQFENMVAQQVQWAGKVPCYPGIGESASSSRLGVEGVIEQIQITRRHRTGGFVIFNYGVPEARDLLPLLGLGITRK